MSKLESRILVAVLALLICAQLSMAWVEYREQKRRGENLVTICEIVERRLNEPCGLISPR